MSEFTKGELEENQSCCNSIDLISKEDGSIVAQITECEEDELSNIQRANAKELVRRWNSQPDLLKACEKAFEESHSPKVEKILEAAIAKATHKP